MQKGSALPVLIVLILLLGIGGFFGYGYFTKSQVTVPNAKNDGVQVVEKVQNFPDPLVPESNEQIYSDKKNGFQFTIPEGYRVIEESEEEYFKRVNGNLRENFAGVAYYEPAKFLKSVYVVDETGNMDTNPFSLWVFENPDQLTGMQFYDKYWYYPFIWGDYDISKKEKYAPDEQFLLGGMIGTYPAKGESKIVDYQLGPPRFIYSKLKDKMFLIREVNSDNKTGEVIRNSFYFPADIPAEQIENASPQVMMTGQDE